MRLTVYTDYSLRLLIYLAVKGDGLITIGEVATAYGISRTHLTKVAHQLGLVGYVETVRGRKGGLRLACSAAAIGLGEVVRRTEPDFAFVPCFEPLDAPCPIRPCCVLRQAMLRARDALLETLDGYSLADLALPQARLRAALALEPLPPPVQPGRVSRRRSVP